MNYRPVSLLTAFSKEKEKRRKEMKIITSEFWKLCRT
jgi:hypothetical protein